MMHAIQLNIFDRGADTMRTSGQGQAAVPGERGFRRREQLCLYLLAWAVG